MATGRGIFRVKGRIGDLVFYTSNDQQYIKQVGSQKGKRMSTYDKNDPRIITLDIRLGINYYATALYRLMKLSGVRVGRDQFNEFKNRLYYGVKSSARHRDTIEASSIKRVAQGYSFRNNHMGSKICVSLQDDELLIENLSSDLGPWNPEENFQLNVYRLKLANLQWDGKKYPYDLSGVTPDFVQLRWKCTPDNLRLVLPLEDMEEDEFIVMGILPLVSEDYPIQTGAGVWVF